MPNISGTHAAPWRQNQAADLSLLKLTVLKIIRLNLLKLQGQNSL